MAKVFRLYKEGAQFTGWNSSPAFPYNSMARATIEDPDGASAKNEITSIPSPFARIDLVKTAFREICRRANADINKLVGNTIFHKMVSDTLDVGEIFFNIDKLADKVRIITWNCATEIQNLKEDNNGNHYYLADSLDKFLRSDAQTYNFDEMRNVYLLDYVNGPDELNIIGATSPATLFFCGANKLDYIHDIFFPNNDRPFDSAYQPLFNRDFEYIKAWWVLRRTIPDFANLFPEVDDYLNLTFRAIHDQTLRQKLNNITEANIMDFSTIDVQSDGALDQVEVLGYQLLKKKSGMTNKSSEFTIKSRKIDIDGAPLVLPIEAGNKYSNLSYVNGAWGSKNRAAILDAEELSSRVLPYDGSKYPYLTIGDFLEDTLLKVPHKLNNKEYFDGNISGNADTSMSYLLPVKPLYFKYFTPEDLMSTMADGKKSLEMSVVAGGSVMVTLRIPISGNQRIKYMEYSRMYYVNRQPNVTMDSNEGGISAIDFAGFVMPGVKFQNDADAYYTVSYISTFSNQAILQFYKEGSVVQNVETDCRNKQRGVFDYKADTYTIKHSNFDFIRIEIEDGRCGLLLPSFVEHQGLETFEFSVDLGTSNTHIEMKRAGDDNSEPFFNEDTDSFMSKFFQPGFMEVQGKIIPMNDLRDVDDVMNADYIPSVIGKGDFCFPTRTALSCAKTINWDDANRVFGLLNFCMTYDKKVRYQYNSESLVNIKWSNESNAQEAMSLYIENIVLLIRNKVVSMNGNLATTKITWFYPDSMSMLRLDQLRRAWSQTCSELFAPNGCVNSMSESVAPIKYYFMRYAEATNLINIDIGGGTTDIAFSSGGRVNYITSFRFAANSLFEDSFSKINPNNGIVDWFKVDIKKMLDLKEGCSDLKVIFKKNDGHPANMASFLFSLKDITATNGLNKNKIDFNLLLQKDDKFKVVFVLFYTAIVYHIAQIVKSKNLDIPRHIAFSGNGSKILGAITGNVDTLASYTKVVFEKVLDKKCNHSLEILGLDGEANPKEATCKGGLLPIAANDAPRKLTLKNSDGDFITDSDSYASIKSDLNAIQDSVKRFFEFVFDKIPRVFDLVDAFGITRDSLELARKVCVHDLDTYLEKGYNLSVTESGDEERVVEEALPFYPIKGVMQALSMGIYNNIKPKSEGYEN